MYPFTNEKVKGLRDWEMVDISEPSVEGTTNFV